MTLTASNHRKAGGLGGVVFTPQRAPGCGLHPPDNTAAVPAPRQWTGNDGRVGMRAVLAVRLVPAPFGQDRARLAHPARRAGGFTSADRTAPRSAVRLGGVVVGVVICVR